MKENVFDVLIYLFENCMNNGPDFDPDHESLTTELRQAGFRKGEINKAFTWLEGLSVLRESRDISSVRSSTAGNFRYYTPAEQDRLDAQCRGFLVLMENNGVFDAATRELVVDRVMALDAGEVTLEQLKWVILLVLFNQPGREHVYNLLEDLVFENLHGHLH
jgi:Smg protein